ncbi:RpiB/LacA/LacB family sugar-phosphate isomerase [Actinomyces qiguomingii]|uniref:RpiB/LacA/LacB family sugar-phosphate isomerase n=1 Tax=Actinomyces qiguomingii TaxID=2057800 RepID=UPI000CA03806
MKIAWGSDQSDHPVVRRLEEVLIELGHDIHSVPAHGGDWVDVGHQVGNAVACRRARRGVACCSTGTGVAMAANKIPGAHAAVCSDREPAEQVRLFNHANVLALSLERTAPEDVEEIVKVWLRTPDGAEQRDSVDRLETR